MLGQPTRNPGQVILSRHRLHSCPQQPCLVLFFLKPLINSFTKKSPNSPSIRVYKPITLVKTAFQNIQQLPQVHTNQQVFETL